jgi:sugar phosphate isomerase/epimerase
VRPGPNGVAYLESFLDIPEVGRLYYLGGSIFKNDTLKNLLALLFVIIGIFNLKGQPPEILVVQDMSRDSLMKAAGYKWYVDAISAHFSPRAVKEEAWPAKLKQVKGLSTKVYAVNVFLPGNLKVVGPNVNEKAILAYADTVFRRVEAAGIPMIIWGSGGSRRVPEGFDHETAKTQFVSIAKKLAVQARKYDIQLVLENLNHTETNFINRVSEIIEIAEKVDERNFRICVDIYHMLMEGEGPDIISKTGKYLVHCDIAEKNGRTPPGTNGDDFTPYLVALKAVGYKSKITMECNWKDVNTQIFSGKAELQRQVDAVFK